MLGTFERLGVVAEMPPSLTEIVVNVGVARRAFEGALEQFDGIFEMAGLTGDHAKKGKRFRLAGIEREGLAVQLLSFAKTAGATLRMTFGNERGGGWRRLGAGHSGRLDYAAPDRKPKPEFSS